jgi:hypothetical protein
MTIIVVQRITEAILRMVGVDKNIAIEPENVAPSAVPRSKTLAK